MGKIKEKLRVIYSAFSLFLICVAIWLNRDKYCFEDDDYDFYHG